MSELGLIWEKLLPLFKRNKVKSIFIYLFFLIYFSLPGLQIPILEFHSTRISSLMEQRGIENFLFFYPKQNFVEIEDINPNLLRAIISMEDGSFFNHHGVDWKELKSSLKVNTRRKKNVRGGSTITMQLSKNLYFTTHKSFLRKAKELLVTFRMEKELSKRTILEQYVNVIEWGDGVFGIQKASEVYFDKEPIDLTTTEAAKLAAVIPSPLKHQPDVNSRYVQRRSSIIRARLSDVVLDF